MILFPLWKLQGVDIYMDKKSQLKQLYQDLEAKKTSLPLGDINEPIVPGIGDPESKVLFIGEAPGFHESQQLEPFVGRSGQLFTKVLEGMGIQRKSVYITNIVKIRPPENRDPTPEEIIAFKPYLDQETQIVAPELIVTLGRLSMGKFLPDVKISQVHGRLHRVLWNDQQLHILPMYHPAAALRNPTTKASFEEDLAKIPKVLAWIEKQKAQGKWENEVKEALL